MKSECPKLEDGVQSHVWEPQPFFHNCANYFCNRPMQSTVSDFVWTQYYCCKKCADYVYPKRIIAKVEALKP